MSNTNGRRPLGRSGIHVAPICIGCWQADFEYWQDSDERNMIRTIRAGLDHGLNAVDTAESYGQGSSEEIVGKALHGRRDQVVLATKVWYRNLEPGKLRPAFEQSLRRLRTDYIDLYQIHWPTSRIPVERPLEEMMQLKEEGRIRAIGVSNFDLPLLERAVRVAQIDSLQPCFSVVWREIDDAILPFCRAHGIGVMAYSPMAQALILGRYKSLEEIPARRRRSNVLTRESVFPRVVRVSNMVAEMADKYRTSPAQVALNWVIGTSGLTCAIAGARRAEQILDSARASSWELSDEDRAALEAAGREAYALIPEGETLFHWKPDGFGSAGKG